MTEPNQCFDVLLAWCQRRTRGYDACAIVDLLDSWKNGIAFCSILHEQELLDVWELAELDPNNPTYNLQLAFNVASENGIPQSLTAVDMQSPSLTEARVAIYLAEWYHFFKNRSGNRRDSVSGVEVDVKAGILAGRSAGYDRTRPIPQVPRRKQPPKTPSRRPTTQQRAAPPKMPPQARPGPPKRPPVSNPANTRPPQPFAKSPPTPGARKGPPRSPGPRKMGAKKSPRGNQPIKRSASPNGRPQGRPAEAHQNGRRQGPPRSDVPVLRQGPPAAARPPAPRKQAPPSPRGSNRQAPPSPRGSPRPSPRKPAPRSPRGSASPRKSNRAPLSAAPAVPQMPPAVPQMPQQNSPSKRPPMKRAPTKIKRAPTKVSKLPPVAKRAPAVKRRIYLPPQFNSAYIEIPLEPNDCLEDIAEDLSAITGSEEPRLYLSPGDGSCIELPSSKPLNALAAKYPDALIWLAEGAEALQQQRSFISQWHLRSKDLEHSLSTPIDPDAKIILNVSVSGDESPKSSIKLLVTDSDTCLRMSAKALRKLKMASSTGSFALVHSSGEYYFSPNQRILPIYLQHEEESPQLYFTLASVTKVRVFAPKVGKLGSQATLKAPAQCDMNELAELASKQLGLPTRSGSMRILPCGGSPVELDPSDPVYPHVAAYDPEFCWLLFEPSAEPPPVKASTAPVASESNNIAALRKAYAAAKNADDLEEALRLKKKIAQLESSAPAKPRTAPQHGSTLTADDDPFGDPDDLEPVVVAKKPPTQKKRVKSAHKARNVPTNRVRRDSVMELQDQAARRETVSQHVASAKKRAKTGELFFISEDDDGERPQIYACLLGDSFVWWADRLCGTPIEYLTLSDPNVSLKANRDHPGAFDVTGCFGGTTFTFKSAAGVQDTAKWIKATKSGCKTGYLLLGTLSNDIIQGTVEMDGRDVWLSVEHGYLFVRQQRDSVDHVRRVMLASAHVGLQDDVVISVIAEGGDTLSFETEDRVEAEQWLQHLSEHKQVLEELLSQIQLGAEAADVESQ